MLEANIYVYVQGNNETLPMSNSIKMSSTKSPITELIRKTCKNKYKERETVLYLVSMKFKVKGISICILASLIFYMDDLLNV